MRMRYYVLATATLLALAISAPSFAQTGFIATLSGRNVVPAPTASLASGSAVFVLNAGQTSLSISVQFQDLIETYTASHIHSPAFANTNAPARFSFSPTLSNANHNGTFNGVWDQTTSPPLTAKDVSDLLNGMMYVDIHSNVFPGLQGEVRGQILINSTTPVRGTSWGRVKALYSGR